MATKEVPAEVDSRLTCSVCLEAFRGRQPKLLPCYHTFCSPCLTQLTTAGQHTSSQVAGDSKGTSSTVTCPTCRATHPLPPGGVSEFLTNFYVDDGTTATAQQEDPPGPWPSQDGDDLGDDLQIKVKEQIAVMVNVTDQLTEEEKGIKHQMKAVELDIQTRYETGLRLLMDNRDACLVTLKEAGQQLTNKTQAEMSLLQNMKTTLQQLSDRGPLDRQTPAWKQKVQDALLSDAAMGHFGQLLSVKPEAPVLSYVWSDNSADVTDSLQLFMGEVTPSGSTVRSKAGDDSGELLALRRDLMALQEDLGQLKTIVAAAADVGGLKKAVTALGDDMMSLQKDLAKTSTDVGTLQTEITAEVGKLQQDQATTAADVGNLQKSVMSEISSLQKELATVQKDTSQSQQTQKQTDTLVAQLKAQMGKLNTSVFFNAQLSKHTVFSTQQKLILDNVLTNTGGGYDSSTGIFTAPVTATYLFMATNVGTAGYDCLKQTLNYSIFQITVEGKAVASSWCKGRTSCTAHTVVRLTAGHKVWLQADSETQCCARGDGYTSFCGLVVQQEI